MRAAECEFCDEVYERDYLAEALDLLARLREAIGLATTAVPNMEMDVHDPIGMMQRVVAEADRLRKALERIATHLERGELLTHEELAAFARAALSHAEEVMRER